jgi:hypothetical protein
MGIRVGNIVATCQPLGSRMMVWLIKNVACCAAWPGSPLVNVTGTRICTVPSGQCSRLQLVRIRIKVPGPLVVAAEHIKRGFRASNLYTASDPQEVRNSTASIPRPLVSESWNLGRIRVHLPFIRGFTYCPGAPLGTPSRKYQNKAPLAQSARRVARSIRQISGLL